jgi:hypothetical protein
MKSRSIVDMVCGHGLQIRAISLGTNISARSGLILKLSLSNIRLLHDEWSLEHMN